MPTYHGQDVELLKRLSKEEEEAFEVPDVVTALLKESEVDLRHALQLQSAAEGGSTFSFDHYLPLAVNWPKGLEIMFHEGARQDRYLP
ncbi:hypothetical protein BJY04DRAFT_38139 [Aspergillus karnatakaensis]|uniref:uncharacterized protein n=1 Tax=Aspergillus karnatakaensis TaxID=1810916 RepID=UPI003CCCC336